MKNNFKKITASFITTLFILLILLPGFTVSAVTNTSASPTSYVALGDSISYGMSAKNNEGYTTLLYNYLKTTNKYQNLTFTNFSKPGDTTNDLLKKINTKDVQAKLATANIVTISIGGNNFLGPVIGSIGKLFGAENAPGATIESTVTQALSSHPVETYLKLSKLLSPSDQAYKDLHANLEKGVTNFNSDWATIVPQVKALAPNATIYVNTVYNTFSKSDSFYGTLEPLLSGVGDVPGINTTIKTLSPNNYTVLDVHELFQNYKGAYDLLTFSLNKGNFDPHPTDAGHRIIFESILVHVTSISIDKKSCDIHVDKAIQLKSTVLPTNATNPDMQWSSSNKKVATVNEQGLVTSKAKGKATITATSKDGEKKASIVITVKSTKNANNFIIIGTVLGLVALVVLVYFIVKKLKK